MYIYIYICIYAVGVPIFESWVRGAPIDDEPPQLKGSPHDSLRAGWRNKSWHAREASDEFAPKGASFKCVVH